MIKTGPAAACSTFVETLPRRKRATTPSPQLPTTISAGSAASAASTISAAAMQVGGGDAGTAPRQRRHRLSQDGFRVGLVELANVCCRHGRIEIRGGGQPYPGVAQMQRGTAATSDIGRDLCRERGVGRAIERHQDRPQGR